MVRGPSSIFKKISLTSRGFRREISQRITGGTYYRKVSTTDLRSTKNFMKHIRILFKNKRKVYIRPSEQNLHCLGGDTKLTNRGGFVYNFKLTVILVKLST